MSEVDNGEFNLPTSINHKVMSSHESRRFVGAQEYQSVTNFLGIRKATDRGHLIPPGNPTLPFARRWVLDHIGRDIAGGDTVDSDTVFRPFSG